MWQGIDFCTRYWFLVLLTFTGLLLRHIVIERNVPIYRTKVPLSPPELFKGVTHVVRIRHHQIIDMEKVRDVTRRFCSYVWRADGLR